MSHILQNIRNWPTHTKGYYALRAAKEARFDVRHKPYSNVCPHCGRASGSRQCIETNYSCVGCQGWWYLTRYSW